MKIVVNGESVSTELISLEDLKASYYTKTTDNAVLILNGFQTKQDHILNENDEVWIIPKHRLPPMNQLEAMMAARHTPKVHEKIRAGSVVVVGLGGLGSAVATMLARLGVGRLLLVDYDEVEPSNLNRQSYYISHLGMKKTEALRQQLAEINPFIEVKTRAVKVVPELVRDLFVGYDILCEAFDDPKEKAMIVNAVLEQLPNMTIVASSGMAGYESANAILTRRRFSRLYVCGDMECEAKPGWGLMAPRVQICAGHQANMILRLLLGITEE